MVHSNVADGILQIEIIIKKREYNCFFSNPGPLYIANNIYWYIFFVHSVLVTHTDTVKISDFGTSKELSDKSTTMSFAGTVAWMAPEVIRNEPVSEKVDIWLVCTIWLWSVVIYSVLFQGSGVKHLNGFDVCLVWINRKNPLLIYTQVLSLLCGFTAY